MQVLLAPLRTFCVWRPREKPGNLILTLETLYPTARNAGVAAPLACLLGSRCWVWRVRSRKPPSSDLSLREKHKRPASPWASATFPGSEQSLSSPGQARVCCLFSLPPPPRHQLEGFAFSFLTQKQWGVPHCSPYFHLLTLSWVHGKGSICMDCRNKSCLQGAGPTGINWFACSDSSLSGTFSCFHRFGWWSRKQQNERA